MAFGWDDLVEGAGMAYKEYMSSTTDPYSTGGFKTAEQNVAARAARIHSWLIQAVTGTQGYKGPIDGFGAIGAGKSEGLRVLLYLAGAAGNTRPSDTSTLNARAALQEYYTRINQAPPASVASVIGWMGPLQGLAPIGNPSLFHVPGALGAAVSPTNLLLLGGVALAAVVVMKNARRGGGRGWRR